MMDYTVVVCAIASLLIFSSPINARKSISQSPAPAPGPAFVNLTALLTVAGPFSTFLNYSRSTKVIETFQNQANNTEEGITLFVPRDQAFSSRHMSISLSNLTADQLKSLFLFHGVSHYYTLADFNSLTKVNTFAGDALNVTDISGTVILDSGRTNTTIISAVLSTYPVAIYEVDKVLRPVSIFGTSIPPTEAPAPSPVAASPSSIPGAADAPGSEKGDSSDSTSSPNSTPSSSYKVTISFGPLSLGVLAMAAASAFFS
ncbi:hypothetical protein DM860_009047 [Cuscuta australis]|uniref:FAS1 domain-containing protein n=1 Tax=Cuscuta australis TaxID=267555 RepID=A0A328D848_9ASTE|nr:hypothetical protein DM860_009047 [Cuscuta australis]